LLAPLLERETAPVKLFNSVKVIAFTPAVKLDVPGTVNTPVCEIAPLEIIVKFCPTVEAAREVAVLFVNVTALAPLLDNVIAPVKLLLAPFVVKLMPFAPAVKLDVPGTTNAPVCEIAPLDNIVKFCPTDEAASDVAILLRNETLFAPLFDKVIAPVKLLLALANVIAFAPAVKLDAPGINNALVCEIAPLDNIVKFCPTVDPASDVAMLFVNETLFTPLFDKVIAPVKLLLAPLVVKSIAFAPALKLDVPGTVNAPV